MARDFSCRIASSAGFALACPIALVAILVTLANGSPLASAIFALTAGMLLLWIWRLQRVIRSAIYALSASKTTPIGSGSNLIETGIAALRDRVAVTEHRLVEAHPVSGLPVREALLARIGEDGCGLLGAIEFSDFDRLTAFDPALGERIFATLSSRLARMVTDARFMAQVDRGHVGIWFGGEANEDAACAELEAIAYALSDAVVDDGREIVPQVQFRLARFEQDEGLTAAAFLARTLASFAFTLTIHPAAAARHDATGAARERYDFEQDLRQAMARRELSLVFQPLIDAPRRRVSGAEALLRWHHPERGPVSPMRFVPVMEAIGLANEIGTWVLNTAAREAAEWRARGFADLRMAVNLSGLQLEDGNLPLLVERTLQRHGLSAASLEIELTESVATSDGDHCRRAFQQLRAMGVTLAVDDFGTGYSGFSSLRTLSFDKIKIDREFVTDVDTRRDSQAICQSIIALARGLGIRVLAEGVERRAEYSWLRKHGCDHFQGYYFSQPLDAAAFAAFTRNTGALGASLSLRADHQVSIERLSA